MANELPNASNTASKSVQNRAAARFFADIFYVREKV
jgi:hypothetical protein